MFLFAGLKPFQPIWTIAGLWDVAWGRAVILGEMDVARAVRKASTKGKNKIHKFHFLSNLYFHNRVIAPSIQVNWKFVHSTSSDVNLNDVTP